MVSTVEYVAVAALERYGEIRARATRPLTTIVVESLPGRRGLPHRGRRPAGRRGLRSCCRRCCRSTPAVRWCTRATSSASTPGASTRPTGGWRALGLSLDAAVTTFDYIDPGDARRLPADPPGAEEPARWRGRLPGRRRHPGVAAAPPGRAGRARRDRVAAAAGDGQPGLDPLRDAHLHARRAGRRHAYMRGFAALDMETQEALVPGRPPPAQAEDDVRRRAGGSLERPAGLGRPGRARARAASVPVATAADRAPRASGRFPRREGVGRRVRRAAAARVPLRGLPDRR